MLSFLALRCFDAVEEPSCRYNDSVRISRGIRTSSQPGLWTPIVGGSYFGANEEKWPGQSRSLVVPTGCGPEIDSIRALWPYWTVSVVLPVTEPEVAVIVALPTDTPVANPLLLMVARVVSLEVQVTELVITLVLLSE